MSNLLKVCEKKTGKIGMAKCPTCNSRKGKRQCLIVDGFICSLCCGITRKEDLCLECKFYQKPQRKYNDVPAFTVAQMDGNIELEGYGNVIEGALCSYDTDIDMELKDNDAIKIIELLIDKYHFGDQQIDNENLVILGGAYYVDAAIRKDMPDIDRTTMVKIL